MPTKAVTETLSTRRNLHLDLEWMVGRGLLKASEKCSQLLAHLVLRTSS